QPRRLRRTPGAFRRRARRAEERGRAVIVCDVGPRDGLQNDPKTLEPAVRAELVNRLAAAGLRRIEAVSFVNPARVPQMGGAEEVVAAIDRVEGVVYAGLALNDVGFERLADAGLDELHFALACTDSFNQRNQNATVEESLFAARQILREARQEGIRATATLGVAFGCPFEGAVDPGRVLAYAERLASNSADEIVFADTVGVAVPRMVKELVERARARGIDPVGVHLHNTRSTGLANAYVALEAGATVLDASVGGIGGCPFAPRATGNIATEDLVYLLEGMGIDTGIDLDSLIETSRWLSTQLGKELPGMLARAGPFPVSA